MPVPRTRRDLKKGLELIYHHDISRFGLEMHISRGASASKTKCVPPPRCPVLPTLTSTSTWRSCPNNPTGLSLHTCQLSHHIYSRATCAMLKLPHGLLHWPPYHRCLVSSHSCRQRGDCTPNTPKSMSFLHPTSTIPASWCILPSAYIGTYHNIILTQRNVLSWCALAKHCKTPVPNPNYAWSKG